ncbi:MAG TPA: porin [Alphaproteobacteria bacterium]|nr:porin [Alphaproteobacteria bacterium]
MTRQHLLAGAALGALAGSAGPAFAADPVKLTVGGFFKEAYLIVADDNDQGQFGHDANTDGFFNDAEIHFTGSTTLDNGLEVGARVELEGENDDDQVDEAWVWFAGGFGEFRIGSEDEALANACVVPPGGTANFSAFSPNQWGSNGSGLFFLSGVAASNSICTGVDDRSDAQKVVYISPVFGGFQLTASYTPNGGHETHVDGAGPHLGMPAHAPLESRHNFSTYLAYAYDGQDWGLSAGLGGSWEGHEETVNGALGTGAQDFYQAGVNLRFGNFGLGVAGEYFNDARDLTVPGVLQIRVDSWVVGIGASYAQDAWTFGLQYSHREDDNDIESANLSDFDAQQDRVVATVNYALGPGINVDAELGYSWIDTDPEIENASTAPAGADDYDAFEIGIGTSITF